MSASIPQSLHPSVRLLCGPGPCNVEPSALEAMQRPMLGHLDPEFHDIAVEVVDLLRAAFRAGDGALVLPLQATGTSGVEAGLANLLEPGDTLVVGISGFFGRRIAEIAGRHGIEVVAVEADWGEHVPNDRLLEALDAHPEARAVAVVHAETSTGVEHPLAELGAALRDRDVLLLVDCVTSLGGVELEVGAWGIDYASSCTQKCVGAPPGLAPLAVSERAMERLRARQTPVPFSLDLLALERYWVQRPVVYHHTTPILHVYALHEALRVMLSEGLEGRWKRHTTVGAHFQEQVRAQGLELLADPEHQLAPLSAVRVPEGVDGKAVQGRMLSEHNIEIGGGLGPAAPPMWRFGFMGHNAQVETADRVLEAFSGVLADEPVLSTAG